MDIVGLFRGMLGLFVLMLVMLSWPSLFIVRLWTGRGWSKIRLVGVVLLGWSVLFTMSTVAPWLNIQAKTSAFYGWFARYAGARAINQQLHEAGFYAFFFHYLLFQTLLPLPILLAYVTVRGGSLAERTRKRSLSQWLTGARNLFPQREKPGLIALGVEQSSGKKVYLGHERTMHTHIIGASGVGKTEAIKKLIEADIRDDNPVVWIDGKGDTDNAKWFASIVARYGKEHRARYFLPHLRHGSYNPFRYGNPTELADRLVSALDWSEQFYKNAAKEFMLGVFRALEAGNKEFTLSDVCEAATNPRALQRLIAETPDMKAKRILSAYASNGDKHEVLDGLSAQLSVLVHSSYGEMLKGDKNDLDFRTAHTKGMFFYIALPVTAASEFFPSVGKLMIADLNALNSAIAAGTAKKYGGLFSVVIDEFSSFVTQQFVSLISQARSQNFAITIAHQTLADLARLSPEAQLAIMGNTNIKMAFRLEVPADAEMFAKMVGTRQTLEQTYQTEQGIFSDSLSGRGSVKNVEEYVIHPNVIKRLGLGQTAFIRKQPLTYGVVEVARTWHAESNDVALAALNAQLFERKREDKPLAWDLASTPIAPPKQPRIKEPQQRPNKPVAVTREPEPAKATPVVAEREEKPAAQPKLSGKKVTHGGEW